ncbi:MAG: PepSY domain-containing protein [Gammaproteobacteria bacterium]|nr:PepSY domain-containing protein [Gammaproteobacteria bacterium]
MNRLLFVLHRYLGITVGFILLLWCLSGFVMMYVQYPEMSRVDQLRGLAPLNFQECCNMSDASRLTQENLSAVTIEMLDETTPVLRAKVSGMPLVMLDLLRGTELPHITADAAARIAESFAKNSGLVVGSDSPEIIEIDQWTVTGAYSPHRPLYRFQSNDHNQTEWYVSSATGEVVLLTTGTERFWNYFGAVVHWIYPAVLRQHPGLWAQTVIWVSVAGVFLTLTGLYVGVRQFRGEGAARSSPYTGIALWHHYTGLVSGVMTLVWVISGLLSMNPWGLLEGEGASAEARALSGGPMTWGDIVEVVGRLPQFPVESTTVQIELFRSAGAITILATTGNGFGSRFDVATFVPSPLADHDLQGLATFMLSEVPILTASMLEAGDAYYYDHHAIREYPVYRVIADDVEQRRYYLSATTGQLVAKVDSGIRWYRWLVNGLHRGDFIPLLRDRPLWDALMLLMLATVTLLCGIGTYLGIKRLLP